MRLAGGGALTLIEQVLWNKNRDMFTVRLGTALLLAKYGIVGFAAKALGRIMRGFLGFLIEDGTYLIDLALDSYREGKKLKEFEAIATKIYNETTARVYDEAKKQAIRKQYLEIISKLGPVGAGPK